MRSFLQSSSRRGANTVRSRPGFTNSAMRRLHTVARQTIATNPRAFIYSAAVVTAFGVSGLRGFSVSAEAAVASAGMDVACMYKGTTEDGEVFDESQAGQPLRFRLGAGQMIPGFDSAVQGMRVGEKKDVTLEAESAYGQRNEAAMHELPLEQLPPNVEAGMRLRSQDGNIVTVVAVDDGKAKLDFNDPLAGKTLKFSIELVEATVPKGLTKVTLSPGDGKTFPKKGDKLTMHYTGTLAADGSKFDSSVDRGQPFEFTIGVGQVIKGWDEGVMQMTLGEKARLEIPSDMGYGARGAGGAIPPNADLHFEVELLKIN